MEKGKFIFCVSYSDKETNRVKGITILSDKDDYKRAIDIAYVDYGISQKKILGIVSKK